MKLDWRRELKLTFLFAVPAALASQIIACSPPGEGYRGQPIPEGETTFVTTDHGPVTSEETQQGSSSKIPPQVEPKSDGASSSPRSSEASPQNEDVPLPRTAPTFQQMTVDVRSGAPTPEQLPGSKTPQSSALESQSQTPDEQNAPSQISTNTPLLRNQNTEDLQNADTAVPTKAPSDPKDLAFRQELLKAENALDAALKKLQTRIGLANKGEAKTQRQLEAAEDRKSAIARHQQILDSEFFPVRKEMRERARTLGLSSVSPTSQNPLSAESKAEEQQRVLDNMSLLIKRVGEIEASLAKDIASINIDLIMDEQSRNNGID